MGKAKQKGDLLEDLVADMLKAPDLNVETRVKLPVTLYESDSVREFDVVVSKELLGCPIKIAISCKNESAKVTPKVVGDFVDALHQVRILPQHSMIVSVAGFTKGALEQAESRGVKCFVFEGLTKDRLETEVQKSIESTIYYLIAETTISFPNGHPAKKTNYADDMLVCTLDKASRLEPHEAMNALWNLWCDEHIPAQIGKHWIVMVDRAENPRWEVFVYIVVIGLVASVEGESITTVLKHAATGDPERFKVKATFGRKPETNRLRKFLAQDEFDSFVISHDLALVNSVRVPRICWNHGFWPPTAEEVDELAEKFKSGELEKPHSGRQIDLGAAWRRQ